MPKLRYYILVIHALVVLLFAILEKFYYSTLIVLVFHVLTIYKISSCYPNHCDRKKAECKYQCWMRMKHCNHCKSCIHKFDHHCLLMGVCVGQFNHLYYYLFLLSFLWNNILFFLTFFQKIHYQVTIDENGIQYLSYQYYVYSFFMIMIFILLPVTSYLIPYHTFYLIKNSTTWEFNRKKQISYMYLLRQKGQYPFDKGIFKNIWLLFQSNVSNPIIWQDYA